MAAEAVENRLASHVGGRARGVAFRRLDAAAAQGAGNNSHTFTVEVTGWRSIVTEAWLTESVSDEPEALSARVETPAATILCVDCGGTAHLVSASREDGDWYAGDIATYRCSDCRDRWDLVLE